jgi:hypothetical protein
MDSSNLYERYDEQFSSPPPDTSGQRQALPPFFSQRNVQPPAPAYPYAQPTRSYAPVQPGTLRPQPGTAKPTARLPKREALALARRWKRGIVIATLACFAALSGLVMSHSVGDAARQTTPANSSNQVTPDQNQSDPSQSWPDNGGNNFGTDNSNQPPVSGSHVS